MPRPFHSRPGLPSRKKPGVTVLVDHNTYYDTATVVEKVNAVTTKVMEDKPEHLRRFTARDHESQPALR